MDTRSGDQNATPEAGAQKPTGGSWKQASQPQPGAGLRQTLGGQRQEQEQVRQQQAQRTQEQPPINDDVESGPGDARQQRFDEAHGDESRQGRSEK